MCSRFELNSAPGAALARFALRVPPPWPNRPEVRPTDLALGISGGEGRLMRWGLAVEWDKRPLINARAETLTRRAAFRRLLGHRVLVPASAWWEWRVGPDGKSRTRMKLGLAGGDLFSLAGLADGDSVVIVTCASAPSVAHVHDRMPVVLPPKAEAAWADPAVPFDAVAGALRPSEAELRAVSDEASKPAPAQGSLF